MKLDLSRIKTTTKAIVVFFVFNLSMTQIQGARDFFIAHIFPLLVTHPKWSGTITSLFAIALALHRPQAQKLLHDVLGQQPDKPVEPGAQMDNVKVVTKP